jgi:IclR family transcriptional regulator, KDG regulon repressor
MDFYHMKNELPGLLVKALNVLEVFSKNEKPISISELANATGLNISTAYRIAATLVSYGYLRQDGKRGKYLIGLKFLEFNAVLMKTLTIREIALPALKKLRLASGESTNLAIRDRNEVIYVEHIESNYTLRAFTAVGNRAPLHCTGVGKVFLAAMSEFEIKSLMEKPLARFTDNTIIDLKELYNELSMVKREGLAVDNGEMEMGVRCIAAPVKGAGGETVAAISVSAPYIRLNNTRLEELKPLVKEHALEISKIMGYGGG